MLTNKAKLLISCVWCYKFLLTNGLGHTFFENYMSWYAFVFSTLLFPSLIIFVALWSPHTSIFLLLCSCYSHQEAATRGVNDHISSIIFFLFQDFPDWKGRKTQLRPKYYLFTFSKQSVCAKASPRLSFCFYLTNSAVVPKRRYWLRARFPKWLCSF